MSASAQVDWFSQNAPQQQSQGDWFSTNAPKPVWAPSTVNASPVPPGLEGAVNPSYPGSIQNSPAARIYGEFKQGQIAKGLHDIVSTAGQAYSPLALPAAIAAPGAAIGAAALGTAGNYGGKAIAEKMGATPDQAALAGDVGAAALGAGGAKLGSLAQEALPSATRAGQTFQSIRSDVGNVPINTEKVGDSALQLYEQSQRGATLPKAVRQLVMRLSDPKGSPLTYAEAKDFQSNISALSANERMSMKPNTVRLLGQLNGALKDSLEGAADTQGRGTDFVQAMHEYHNAMRLNGFTDKAIKLAISSALAGLGLYGAKQLWSAF